MRRFWIVTTLGLLLGLTACAAPTPTAAPTVVIATDLPATPNIALTPNPTATNPATEVSLAWKIYNSPDYGFAFEYPAAYDETPYAEHNCGVRTTTSDTATYLNLGQRIVLSILPPSPQTLTAFVEQLIQEKTAENYTITSRNPTSVGGAEALMFEYRVGGSNRFGTSTYFSSGDHIYAVTFEGGEFCETLAHDTSGLTEAGAYLHLLETFQFNR